ERSTDDLVAVLDAVGAQRAALIGCDGGGPVALLAAGTHPRRTAALVLVNTFARMARSDDYPAGIPTSALDAWLADSTAQWNGEPGFFLNAPSALDEQEAAAPFIRFLGLAASPGVGYSTRPVLHAVDVRAILE